MDRTIHNIFPGNEAIILKQFPIFPGVEAIILRQFPFKIPIKFQAPLISSPVRGHSNTVPLRFRNSKLKRRFSRGSRLLLISMCGCAAHGIWHGWWVSSLWLFNWRDSVFRPGVISGWSLYQKFDFSLKIDILIDNLTPKIWKFNKVISGQGINFGFLDVFTNFISSQGINFAFLDFFNIFISSQGIDFAVLDFSNKYIHILSISHGKYFFGVQLCIKIYSFSEFCEF